MDASGPTDAAAGTPGDRGKLPSNDVGYRRVRRAHAHRLIHRSAITFAGKKAQAARVEALVREKGFIPADLVSNEGASALLKRSNTVAGRQLRCWHGRRMCSRRFS